MNALVHRDYFKRNEQIMIKIYDDAIWFHNPGGLPMGLSIEQLESQTSVNSTKPADRKDLLSRRLYRAVWFR